MTHRSVMAHMIPFYPDLTRSERVAEALVAGGADYLEIQFPYSDPTADGPAIQAACATALNRGFRVAQGWEFLDRLASRSARAPVFLMSYAGLVFNYGVERFVATAGEHGVTGLIVPDLPIDSDEGLFAAGERHGVSVVPVIALGAGEERLRLVEGSGARYIYAALRRGITGSHTEIGAENGAFVDRLAATGATVMAGFGIATRVQVEAVLEHAQTAVVGSAFVRAITDAAGRNEDPYGPVRSLVEDLSGGVAATG